MTIWHPDTCGCVLEYEWDDSKTPASYSQHGVVRKCTEHTTVPDNELFKIVLDENQRKNNVLSIAKEILPSIEPQNYHFSFNNQRMLQIQVIGLSMSSVHKNQLQAQCNAKYGQGKVEVL
jgi:hypothetical protein